MAFNKSKGKIVLASFITLAVLVAGIVIWAYLFLHNTLPNYNGEYQTNYVNGKVEIFRDSVAVPYIYANSQNDAAFALGFVHAQERLFQMDLMRRAGLGKLSEIIGSKTVPFDKMFKTLQLKQITQQTFDKMDEMTKEHLIAYCNGINYYLKITSDGNLPVEFSILNYRPDKWEPTHSLVIGKLLAWELNISWWTDIAFAHLVDKLGEENVKELLPQYPENAPYILSSNSYKYAQAPVDFMKTDQEFRKFIGFNGTHIGSNNWVVSPAKSITSKPIIANDPHLGFTLPGKWYVASINSPNWNVQGFTLPGVPAIIIGKNKSIAWAVTNVMADDADFYTETLNEDSTKFLVDGEWQKLEIVADTIVVKDSASVVFNILKTNRGPIVSGIHTYKVLFPDSKRSTAPISMRWTALESTEEFSSLLSVNKASSWNDFKQALKSFSVPGQNFVYADSSGNIGYVCAAKLPIRKNQSPTLIFDGKTSENDWKGFVPYNEMPKVFNPETNFIATANNKTLKNFNYHISNLWEPTSRIERITQLLTNKEKLGVNDFKMVQNDFYSKYAKDITKYILEAFKGVEIEDENLSTTIELLRQWNFYMDKEQQAPSIYALFFQNLLKNIYFDEMGESLFNEFVFIANIPYRTTMQLLEEQNSKWFDDITTDEIESKNEIIRKSLVDAIEYLEKNVSTNISMWQWKYLHKIKFKHFFNGVSPIADNLLNSEEESISGDGTTIFNTEYSFTKPFETKLGPSMRFIYDFSKHDEFLFVLPNGQSGNPFSPYYNNMMEQWLSSGYYSINSKRELISKNNIGVIIME